MIDVWCEWFGRGVPTDSGEEGRALAEAAVSVRPFGTGPAGPGLLLFDEGGEAVCARVRDLSGRGSERILAIARTRAALAGGVVWRLLQAGASDVLAWEGTPDPGRQVALRLERCRCTRDDRREIDESLDQLLLFGLTEHAEVNAFARYRVGRNLSHAKDPAHPRVRHLHVVNRVLL